MFVSHERFRETHNRELCTGRECLRCSIVYRRPPQVWRATDYLDRQCANVDAFIALSRSVADNHRAFGFAREMTLMASFVPDAEVGRDDVSQHDPDRTPYFLFVGRLEALKGLQQVIPLFDADFPVDLLIAGAGAYEPELRRLAGDRKRVKFLGHIPRALLPALYRNALALVAPSLAYEVFPMVVLEAFCERTPVIARNLGPYPQIIEESGGGLLFNTRDELRSALALLAQNAGLRERLGARGRRAVATRWSEETAIAAYLALVGRTARARSRPDIADKADRMSHSLVARNGT